MIPALKPSINLNSNFFLFCFNPLQEGFTPLHVASSLGNLDFVNFLINESADINAVDAHGR